MESHRPVSAGISSAVNNRGMGGNGFHGQSPDYMWGFGAWTQQHYVGLRALRALLCPLRGADTRDQFLDLGQDLRDNDVDARGGRMQPVALVELRVRRNAVEEERIEHSTVG